MAIAEEDWKFIRAAKGLSKKCLVLDCDNVLWGGIIGEDGLTGIRLSQDYPGSAFYEFQQEVLALHHRGVILALCSKNNEADVWQVFSEYPDMVLKKEHIAAAQINWDDKVTNLGRLSEDLNIGLDSMVLADDSDFEVEQVRQLLPDVEVLHLPPKGAVENRDILRTCGLFDTLTLSEEDRHRGRMYKAEAARKKLEAALDPSTYLQSLEMEVAIRFVDETLVPRVAQLTQRTNQFNLTTQRYSAADISGLTESATSDVLCLRLKDRLGDYGIVGAAVLSRDGKQADIDTFLLSCRVIGRGVEDALLYACLKTAKLRGASVAQGKYIKTKKNALVADFYSRRGFTMDKTAGDKTVYSFDLTHAIPTAPDHISVVTFGELESEL
jgi:FkbH-like protein